MSGLAPATVYITLGVSAALGLAWLIARIVKANTVARHLGVAFWGATAICLSFLVLDKMVNVGYSKGLYAAIAITVAVGIAAGLTIRKART